MNISRSKPNLYLVLLLVVVMLTTVSGVWAGQERVAVYHLDDEGNYVPISISDPALDIHLAHGDVPRGTVFLLSPAEGEIMDNGRLDGLDPLIWDFEWSGRGSDCEEVTFYHLYVQHSGSPLPLIDNQFIEGTSYHYERSGYVANFNLTNWEWKVRAYVNGVWGPWSSVRTFQVEPVNTDPPLP